MPERTALVVGYHAPEPDRDSGARRLVHLMDLLQEAGWDVRFLAADGIGSDRAADQLRSRGIGVHDGYRVSLREVLADRPVRLALFSFWVTAERYLPTLRQLSPGTSVIIDSVDLHFVREVRRSLRPRQGSGGMGLGPSDAARFAAELNAYAAADVVLTVSDEEARLLGSLLADPSLTRTIPDHEDIRPSPVPFEERRGLVFVGSFQHPPNIEAVAFLCQQVLPRVDPEVLDQHPVYIVGNALDDRVRGLGRASPQVRMVGWVPYVEPYLERARASLVPLLHGAGTKRKLLQSLMTGTPAVSTRIGIEGFDIRHEEHVLVADGPADFAAAIERITTDADLWTRLAAAGREAVLRTNGPEVTRAAFAEALELALSRPAGRPLPVGLQAFDRRRDRRGGRPDPDAILQAVHRACPPGSRLLVMADDDGWLDLPGYQIVPFPGADDSTARHGGRPGVVVRLRELVAAGNRYLVVPTSSLDALDRLPGVWTHLDEDALVVHRDEACAIIDLAPGARAAAISSPQGPVATIAPAPGLSSAGPAPDVRLIAFYLPQFHPIPENDAWWGTGFTEWRNVARADPSFEGHYQPHVPADLGFYDLRLPETRWQQAQLARAHGVHGFAWYHYWFHGKRLLGRPFDEVLASGEPDLPFALCWANDPWSRRWDGRDDELLMAQTYSPEDDLAHIRWLIPALADPRAITVDGKPLFLVYRGKHLPDPARTMELWRREVDRAGLPGIHLVAVETAWDLGWDATEVGFDAKVLFQPQFGWLMTQAAPLAACITVPDKPELQVYDYAAITRAIQAMPPVAYPRYESVFPGWDNTARRGDQAVVMHDADPGAYEAWLRAAVDRARSQPEGRRIVFINAWNEWAEGCHLEPDRRHGRAFLEATSRAVGARAAATAGPG